jgi:hypothetical protein
VSELCFDPAGERLAVGFTDGGAALHDLRTGARLWAAAGYEGAGAVRCAAFSADGRWVAFGCTSGVLSLHEAATGRTSFSAHDALAGRGLAGNLQGISGHEISALAFQPVPGRRELAAGLRSPRYESLAAKIFDFDALGVPALRHQLGHWDGVKALAYRDDGARLATASEDGSVVVWSPETGARLGAPIHLGSYHASRVAFSPGPGDLLLALWTHGDGLRVVIAESGQPLLPPFGRPGDLLDGGFLEDARTLWLVDRRRGPGIYPLPHERRSLAELQALALLLYPANGMALDDARLRDLRDRINRGDADRAVWERLHGLAMPTPPADTAREWR